MRFEHLQILWLLLVVPPAIVLLFWFANRQKQKLLAQFISARLLPVLTTGISPARQKLRFAFLILAVAFLIVALARPQHGFDLEEVQQNGLDIVVAIDTSKSMLTTDIAPNRLERAKLAALELMQRAGADRLGLVAFAGDAFLECPLTIDNTAFQQSVQALNVNSIPQGGTAIAEAINTALTAFKEKGHHKALVLLTDGEDNDSESGALAAAQDAAKDGLKIFTIGIGTAAGDLIRVTDANGNSDYVRDEQGNVVKSHLKKIFCNKSRARRADFTCRCAARTRWTRFTSAGWSRCRNRRAAKNSSGAITSNFSGRWRSAILLLLAEIFSPERKKSKVQSPKSKAETAAVAILIAFLFLPVVASASPTSALSDYKSGNYTNALTEFSRLAEIQTNDLRLVFNAGAAAYRATNYDAALQNFQLVTLSPDLKLQQQAFYNLGNTLYRMGELKFTPSAEGLDAMVETWTNAAQCYAHAVQLNTNDADAAFNFGFVKSQLDLIAQLREAMRRAKFEADDAVRRAEFHRALEIMEQLTQNKIAAKQFQDYTKKLKDVDAIATPNQK